MASTHATITYTITTGLVEAYEAAVVAADTARMAGIRDAVTVIYGEVTMFSIVREVEWRLRA